MTIFTEGKHAGEFIMSEGDGAISRENVTIVSGQTLHAGAVLGKITSGGKYKAYDNNAGDGSQTAVAILIDACDASAADTPAAVIARLAEVNGDCLDWGSQSPTQDAAGIVDLALVYIIVR